MREVSCRAIDPFLRAADRKQIRRLDLVAGAGYSLSHIENGNERIDWDAFRVVMANVGRWFTDEEIIGIGTDGLKSPWVRGIVIVGRTVLSAPGFYRWLVSTGGPGNQMFANVLPRYQELGPERVAVEMHLMPGYETCREFFLFCQGGFQGLPLVLGLGRSEVRPIPLPDGMRFEIAIPPERAWRARLRRMITRRTDAGDAASEIDQTSRELQRRYAQLETTQAEVERQRRLLDTAYNLGQQIWRGRELLTIGVAVTSSLVELDAIAGARLTARPHPPISAGDVGSTTDAVGVDLPGDPIRGRLEAWPRRDPPEVRALLELLAPTVALAIDNAAAYRELADYQRGLERIVDERTLELRQARDQLAATVAQLREAQGARERFFANVSHEIRTPLSLVLLAAADIEARAGEVLDERSRAELASVTSAARRLVRLVDELLLLAASEEAALKLRVEPTDVARLVGTIETAWLPAAEAQGLTLAVTAPATLVARVDPDAIERVATNLVSNAVKYTPVGGRIEIELAATADGLRLSVADTGPGIPDDLRARLFGRFERGEGETASGSGIGLSIVKQLVEAHGGTVAAMARPTSGTEMRVELPAAALAVAGIVSTRSPRPQLRPSDYGAAGAPALPSGTVLRPTGTTHGTILLAEDDPALAEMVARLLAEEYAVVIALDGAAALALVGQHRPQLLVTDVDMPGLDGITLARKFRDVAGDALAPIVILSAVADVATRVAGLEAGAIDYVQKPFDPRELLARVRAQFRMRELAERARRAEQLSGMATLASGLAHELRNPANGLVNAVAPLRARLPAELTRADTATGQLLEVIAECGDQIAFLSHQLIGFNAGGAIETRNVELGDIIDRALTFVQPVLAGREVRRDLDGVGRVRCSPPLVTQVLANLIENAAHAAGRGGWIEIRSRVEGGTVTVEVADSGPGVPPALRERVFEPFYTTKAPGEGTGLGLAMAREIMHRHGGVLEIRDRGERSVFALDLPVSGRIDSRG